MSVYLTDLQKTILEIAEDAKENGQDPIESVQEYFDEKDSHFSREQVSNILKLARDAAIDVPRQLTYRNVTINRIPE